MTSRHLLHVSVCFVICALEDTQKGTRRRFAHHMPITHCFLLFRPPQASLAFVVARSEGGKSPFKRNQAIDGKMATRPEEKGRHGGQEATCSSLMAVSGTVSLRVACIRLSACVCVYMFRCVCIHVGECDCAAYTCVFARLVVCHSAREQPLFTYTNVSRGGTVCVQCVWCVYVCVGVEAGVLAVFGFQRLTPKLFIFWRS